MPRVALYARVSTNDRDQDPETQLVVLRDYARTRGWEVAREYTDHAPANDPAHRVAWRELLDDGARHRFGVVVVFRLDRAFRSVKHMHDTLEAWEHLGIGFQSVREGFDTRTALGRLLLNLLASLAEFELEILGERVRAGMDRARRQGRPVGRPKVSSRPNWDRRWQEARERIEGGELSRRQAARELGVGTATVGRLLAAEASQKGDSAG